MPKNKIIIVKSPVVPMNLPEEGMVIYGNQVTYSVRLANGMIVSRPEEFPNDDIEERTVIVEQKEESE
jgi:hypothetical protein